MDSVSTTKTTVIRLLWDGKPEEARSRIEDECAKLQSAMDELKALLPNAPQTLNGSHVPDSDDDPDAEKDRRRKHVISIASEMAPAPGGKVLVHALVRRLARDGFDLGVQDNRRSTAVSNILLRSGLYTKTGKGRYIRK